MGSESKILSRVREGEGPFGELTGHYSDARPMPVAEITKVSHRRNPLCEHLYLGVPWTEIDYLWASIASQVRGVQVPDGLAPY